MSSTRTKGRSFGVRESKREVLAIGDLRFDPDNPRIADLAGQNPTQAQIRDLLLGSNMEARDLVPSFIENGYLPYEPLIVRQEQRGKYVVLEGNRRLAAILSMRDSEDPQETEAFQRHRLERVPCLIFDGDEKEELAYLGLRHLSKTKDWGASAKAAFVERILCTGRSIKDAARITNTTPHNLRLLLLTRRLFEKAGELGLELPTSSAEGEIAFWHLGDAIRRTNTKQFLSIVEHDDPLKQPQLDEHRFEQLLGWLYGNTKTGQSKLISSIRDVPDLDKCLSHRRAINVLEGGGTIEEAKEELETAGANVTAHLERAKKSIQRATGLLSDVDAAGRKVIQNTLNEVEKALGALKRELNAPR